MAIDIVELQTSLGTIRIQLDAERAPISVASFLRHVDEGHYNGTIFHRVIDRFMLQGGGYDTTYEKKQTHAPITNEADNGLKNTRGTVAMARTSDPHSATAQFFVNVADNAFLNHRGKSASEWGYAVFGRVVEGMDVVDQIKSVPTGSTGPFRKDAPLTDVVITSAQRV